MNSHRFRVFRDGAYKFTSEVETDDSFASTHDVIPMIRWEHGLRVGDIVYIDDFYFELVDRAAIVLDADDPKVQGLYAKAAQAERQAFRDANERECHHLDHYDTRH